MAALCVDLRRIFDVVPSHNVHAVYHCVSPHHQHARTPATQIVAGMTPLVNSKLTYRYSSLGFDRTEANALAAVGGFLALAVVFSFAFISDRTNRRGATVVVAQLCYLVTLVVARQLHPHVGKWSRWGLWTAVNGFAVGYHPSHNSWLQLNCHEGGERSIAIA